MHRVSVDLLCAMLRFLPTEWIVYEQLAPTAAPTGGYRGASRPLVHFEELAYVCKRWNELLMGTGSCTNACSS
jgi:hypothetical protein